MTTLPPESLREVLGNLSQILMGATPSALGSYRLLPSQDYDRAWRLLRAAIAKADELAQHRCALPASVIEALNSGDGSYRP